MALLKCKMCGGSLEVVAGETIIECEYCGTQQTLPKTTDENIQSLFNRANLLRQKSEFDKAEAVYEKIIEADHTEAEAYWGAILCKFGVEYVEDPKTYKRIPTCHRTSYDSIVADEYYKKALEAADISQRTIYEAEAKKIDEIQRGILSVSSQEEPYDVFICYKETDESGKRTQDSVIANDIYHQLTQEGFKVFYAAITLEDKLGSAYEPIIFAALNSSKVMLSIGTKPEYFNAVWVKNEWSRFLKMMKNDRTKMLIPCYKGMDAYELPEEFAHLQAQDMGKIGFINDIVRGIKKIIVKDEPKATVVKETVVTANASVGPLLKRAFMFLEDGNWDSANEYAERVLDADPENAEAYLVKLMADLCVRRKEQLADCRTAFDENDNYCKTIRFAGEKLKDEMVGYIEHINIRNENERLAAQYESIVRAMNMATTENDYKSAAERFAKMGNYSDAPRYAKECLEKAEIARVEALERAEIARKNTIYVNACQLKSKNTIRDIEQAIAKFREIPGWKDSQELIYECEKRISEIKAEQERRRLEKERQEELARIAKENRIQKTKKFFKIATPIAAGVIVCVLLMVLWIIPAVKFNNAISLMEEGKYSEARTILVELDGFGSSENKIAVIDSIDTINDGEYDAAIKDVLSASEAMNVKYNLNGGISSSGDSFTYATSSDYSSLLIPEKEGYRFVRWMLSGYSYSKDNSLELVLDAVWSDGYFITYKLDGGSAFNPTEYHKEGDAITLSNPKRTGYTFVGWTGTDLTDLTVNVTIPAGSYGDREYIANWKPIEYIFTLDANGGTVSSSSIPVNYDAAYTLPKPMREYYVFDGWYDGTNKYESGIWNKTSNVTLTAKWTPVSYTITYDLSGGTNSSQNVNNFTVESSKILMKEPTRTGYKFLGWYKESSYSTKVTEIAAGSHENVSLYAKWEIINYTITYNLNGGSISGTKKTVFTVNDLPLTLATPTRNDYVFTGWKKDSSNGADISKITNCENITVYATYRDVYLQLKPAWENNQGYYIVDKYSGTAATVDIPSYYGEYPVREIASGAFSGNTNIITINIPSTVQKIGSSAFSGCSNLKIVNISDGVTTIDSEAFSSCEALVSLTIPNSVTYIGTKAFYNCRSIKSVNIPVGVKTLRVSTFGMCTSLTNVIIPNTVQIIQGSAFQGCSSLTKVIIPASVEGIGADAFSKCPKVTIYCRATDEPNGWFPYWNGGRPVVWGYEGD